jgi:hypothetical protein
VAIGDLPDRRAGSERPVVYRKLIGAVGLVALAVTACSSSSKSTPPGGSHGSGATRSSAGPAGGLGATSDAKQSCALVSAEDVQAAFGGTAGKGTVTPSPAGSDLCTVVVTGSNLNADLDITVQAQSFLSVDILHRMAADSSLGVTTAPGIGDAAVVGNSQVQFIKGSSGFSVLAWKHDSVGLPKDKQPAGHADLVAYAKRLAARL